MPRTPKLCSITLSSLLHFESFFINKYYDKILEKIFFGFVDIIILQLLEEPLLYKVHCCTE